MYHTGIYTHNALHEIRYGSGWQGSWIVETTFSDYPTVGTRVDAEQKKDIILASFKPSS